MKNFKKKAEAYIDTVVTVFISLMIVYVVLNLFSYMITYQKLGHAADNIVRYAAIKGTTDEEIIGDKIEEFITSEGFNINKVNYSFDGTEYVKTNSKYVQYGDTIMFNINTKQSYKLIKNAGVSWFTVSLNKVTLSEEYYSTDKSIDNGDAEYRPDAEKLIPKGGIYTIAKTGQVLVGDGETVEYPDKTELGDTFEYEDYKYTYQTISVPNGDYTLTEYDGHERFDVPATFELSFDEIEGWNAKVIDINKSYYGSVLSKINQISLKGMVGTYENCKNFTNKFELNSSTNSKIVIPDTVLSMEATFKNSGFMYYIANVYGTQDRVNEYMDKLSDGFFSIPDSVLTMKECFYGISNDIIGEEWSCYEGQVTADVGYSLEGFNLPANVIDLSYCFANSGVRNYYSYFSCTTLTSVLNADSMWANCTSLEEGSVPNSAIWMPRAYYNCRSLYDGNMSASCKYYYQTFYGCKTLMTLPVIPDGTYSLNYAFQNANMANSYFDMSNYNIPSSVKSMRGTFKGCTGIKSGPKCFCDGLTASDYYFYDLDYCFFKSSIEWITALPGSYSYVSTFEGSSIGTGSLGDRNSSGQLIVGNWNSSQPNYLYDTFKDTIGPILLSANATNWSLSSYYYGAFTDFCNTANNGNVTTDVYWCPECREASIGSSCSNSNCYVNIIWCPRCGQTQVSAGQTTCSFCEGWVWCSGCSSYWDTKYTTYTSCPNCYPLKNKTCSHCGKTMYTQNYWCDYCGYNY